MSYTTPVDSGADGYILTLKHNASGILAEVTLVGVDAGSPAPSRATKDAVFQAIVDKLAGISGATILSARRVISYASDVTPTP